MSEQQLEQASKHVNYEIDMLKATANLLSKGSKGMDRAIWNACLESFVLHLRNLIDFFYPPGNAKSDDILAVHYVKDAASWGANRPAKTQLLKDAKEKANKQLAHLTYSRVGADKNWSWLAIQDEVRKVVTCFFNHLPNGRRTWFADAQSQWPARPSGTPNQAVGVGWTGPAGPTSSGGGTGSK